MKGFDYEPIYRWRARKKTEKNQRNAEKERQKAAEDTKQHEIVRSLYTIFNEYQDHNNEERSRKYGDRVWEIAGVAALLLAAAVGAIAILVGTNDSSELRGAMHEQLTEMQEARRPWIQGDIRFIGPLVFNQSGAQVPIILSLANSGHSPAKNVWRGARLFAGDGPDDLILSWENAVCKNVIRDARKGFTIFPNETPGNSFPVWISGLDVKNNINPDGEIILRIIACIDYTFAFSREHHQTSYIWEIDKSNPATGFAHIKPSDGTIQTNDLLKLTDPSLPGRVS
jgi:hypothetical protein